MNITTLKKILLRLFNNYIKKHVFKIIIALFLSFGVAGGTASIAWLLDPAIKKIFVEQNKSMLLLIPAAIMLAFTTKGISLFFARKILIKLGNEVVRVLQLELSSCILKSDTHTLESKHSGRYIQHFLYDISLISNMVASGTLNLMKDSLTLIVLIALMFFLVSFWIKLDKELFSYVSIITIMYIFILFFIYLSTPFDFYWQIDSSAARVIRSLSFLLAFFGLYNLKNYKIIY